MSTGTNMEYFNIFDNYNHLHEGQQPESDSENSANYIVITANDVDTKDTSTDELLDDEKQEDFDDVLKSCKYISNGSVKSSLSKKHKICGAGDVRKKAKQLNNNGVPKKAGPTAATTKNAFLVEEMNKRWKKDDSVELSAAKHVCTRADERKRAESLLSYVLAHMPCPHCPTCRCRPTSVRNSDVQSQRKNKSVADVVSAESIDQLAKTLLQHERDQFGCDKETDDNDDESFASLNASDYTIFAPSSSDDEQSVNLGLDLDLDSMDDELTPGDSFDDSERQRLRQETRDILLNETFDPEIMCQWDQCRTYFKNVGSLLRHVRLQHLCRNVDALLFGEQLRIKRVTRKSVKEDGYAKRGKIELGIRCRWRNCQNPIIYHKRGILLSHVRVHFNERPFACHRCGAAFSVDEQLTSHVQVKHSCKETKNGDQRKHGIPKKSHKKKVTGRC